MAAPVAAVQPLQSPNESQEWDAIIIGSGLGGLALASTLSQLRGWKCLVLEQHWTMGGMTHQFEREGKYWFSSGTHYVGRMSPQDDLGAIMHFVTNGVSWGRLPEHFNVFCFQEDGATFAQSSNPKLWAELLIKEFPKEEKAIHQFFKELQAVTNWHRTEFFAKALGPPLSWGHKLLSWLGKHRLVGLTAQQYVDTHFRDDRLKGVLTGIWGDWGLKPNDVNHVQFCCSTLHVQEGTWYPRGGSRAIPKAMRPIIEDAGGCIMTSTTVEEIIVQSGRAVGVRALKSGVEKCFHAKHIISDAGAYNTFRKLLKTPLYPQLEQPALTSAGYGGLCLYLGLHRSPKEAFGMKGENLWISKGYQHSDAPLYNPNTRELHYAFVTAPSMKEHRVQGHTLEIIIFSKYEYFQKWANTEWQNRGEEYNRLKASIEDDMITFCEGFIPGLRDEIAYSELATPLSFEKFNPLPQGTFYGAPQTLARLQNNYIFQPRTPIKGLWLVGADSGTGGVAPAALSGMVTAARILYPMRGISGIAAEVVKTMRTPGWGLPKVPAEATSCELLSIQSETSDSSTLTFQLPEGVAEQFAFEPGQYTTVLLHIEGEEVRRPYSISSLPSLLPLLSITVKEVPGGLVSNHLQLLQPGAKVHLLPPLGDFTLRQQPEGQRALHLMFAAGSGIGPVLPMMETALQRNESNAAALLYCNRTSTDVILGSAVAALAESAEQRCLLQHCYSQQQVDGALHGRLSTDGVTTFLQKALAQFSVSLEDVRCYLCGPTEWMAVVAGALRSAGVPQDAIVSEEFSPPGGAVDVDYASHGLLAVPRTATFLTAGSGAGGQEVHVPPGKTLLAEAREAGVTVPYSCQSGACKLCRATLCSGAVLDLEDGVVVTEPGSTVLTCRAVPATDVLLKLA